MTAPLAVSAIGLEPRVLSGRYELGPVIGRGGMSTVYEGFDRRLARRVAVKVFAPGTDLAESTARRQREFQLASSVRHPRVVAVFDADLDERCAGDGCAYLVTELVSGPTLGQRIKQSPLSEQQVATLGAALCAALAYVHRFGIIHRDIKPANVLLTGDEDLSQPKLADFGIALMVDSTRMTATGYMTGTANYLSPEQVRGAGARPASDVYSLGLVLIEALTGTPAFGGHGIEAALAHLNHNPAIPSGLNVRLGRLLSRMTHPDPQRRPTAAEAADQFGLLASGSLTSDIFALGAAEPRTVAYGRSMRTSNRLRAGLLGALTAAAAVGIILALTFGASPSQSRVTPLHLPASNPASSGASAAATSAAHSATQAAAPAGQRPTGRSSTSAASKRPSSNADVARASSPVAPPAVGPSVNPPAGPGGGPAGEGPGKGKDKGKGPGK